MNRIDRARRGGIVAAVVATVAIAAGAAGVDAGAEVPVEPVATEAPVEEAAAPTTSLPIETTTTSTLPPTTTAPVVEQAVPTTTAPAVEQAVPTTTSPPVSKPATTSPQSAIATTTTVPEPVSLAATVPSAPRSPVAQPGNGSITLTWVAPATNGGASISNYLVQRWTSAGWKNVASQPGLSYTSTGLSNGAKYSFRITAGNSAGYGSFSATASAVPRTVPTAPRSPVAKAANASVTLTWLAPSSTGGAVIDKYVVQRLTASGWKTIASPTGLSYTVTGLGNGTKYSFRIAAHNGAGYGPYSVTVAATPHSTLPTAPRSPVATPGNASLKLTWLAPSSNGGAVIDKYVVQRLTASGWKTIASPTGLSYTVTGLSNGTKYYFRVRAQNVVGVGPYSATVSAVPRTVPTVPLSLTASVFDEDVLLAWSPPASTGGAPILHYTVSVSTDANGPWTHVADPMFGVSQKPSIYVSNLTLGTKYYFRVTAHNVAGSSPAAIVSAVPS
jgi:fibronectin type III domain protein